MCTISNNLDQDCLKQGKSVGISLYYIIIKYSYMTKDMQQLTCRAYTVCQVFGLVGLCGCKIFGPISNWYALTSRTMSVVSGILVVQRIYIVKRCIKKFILSLFVNVCVYYYKFRLYKHFDDIHYLNLKNCFYKYNLLKNKHRHITRQHREPFRNFPYM